VLPSAALNKAHSTKKWSAKAALPSATPALDKGNGRRQPDDTLCRASTWQTLSKGNFFLKNSLPSADVLGTQQRFIFFEKFFAECHVEHSVKILFFKKKAFVECWHLVKVWSLCRVPRQHSTMLGSAGKNAQLCRVQALGKAVFFLFFCFLAF
jgi:hypothetical protein